MESVTYKRTQLYSAEIPENKIMYHNNTFTKDKSFDILNKKNTLTQIVVYSNFTHSETMTELLKFTPIFEIVQLNSQNQQIITYPLYSLNYCKQPLSI